MLAKILNKIHQWKTLALWGLHKKSTEDPTKELKQKGRKELKSIAHSLEIRHCNMMSREELIDAIEQAYKTSDRP